MKKKLEELKVKLLDYHHKNSHIIKFVDEIITEEKCRKPTTSTTIDASIEMLTEKLKA